MITFTKETIQEILPYLIQRLETTQSISFNILNPDTFQNTYAGEEVIVDGTTYLYHGYKAWSDLAELLMCTMRTPKECTYPYVTLTFVKLQTNESFHHDTPLSKIEKYGTESHFWRINKMEEPAFYYYYVQALQNVKLEQRHRLLNLGINKGDEFEVIRNILDTKKYQNMKLVGIDHSHSAISYANERFHEKNVAFYRHDVNDIDTLALGKFDLLISIGTLQSPGINFKPFFMKLVQNYLSNDAAIILGFPNSRWVGGEMIYGAKAPNYSMSEQSLLYNDVIFCKKYLQQKKYRVTLTGKQYLFLTATRII